MKPFLKITASLGEEIPTCEEGRQSCPISRFWTVPWKEGCTSTTPCNSTIAHSGHFSSPQLHFTWICISTFFSPSSLGGFLLLLLLFWWFFGCVWSQTDQRYDPKLTKSRGGKGSGGKANGFWIRAVGWVNVGMVE